MVNNCIQLTNRNLKSTGVQQGADTGGYRRVLTPENRSRESGVRDHGVGFGSYPIVK